MKRSLWITVTCVILVIIGLGGIKYWMVASAIAAYSKLPAPLATVSVSSVKLAEWQPKITAVGTAIASQRTKVCAENAGVVGRITFTSGSGSFVNEGALLVVLSNEEEKARLDAAVARNEVAKNTLTRQRKLFDSKLISQSALDDAISQAKQVDAEVRTLHAVLEKRFIRAPFAGYISINDISVGQYLAAGAEVADIQALSPIYVDFKLTQQHTHKIHLHDEVKLKTESAGELSGTIYALDSSLDDETRSLRIRAIFPNVDNTLRPGMFGEITAAIGPKQAAVVLPKTAIRQQPYASSVFSIEKSKNPNGDPIWIAHEKIINIIGTDGDSVIINSGVQQGEQVATAGIFKLRDGVQVDISKQAVVNVSGCAKECDENH